MQSLSCLVILMTSPLVPTFHPAKLLVPTDFSPSSHATLEAAVGCAEMFQAELHLLHVVARFPVVPTLDGPTCFWPEGEFLQDARTHAETRLAALVAQYQSRGIKAAFSVEVGDDVVGNILRIAEEEHIGLIILSTHGVSGWRPMVFGSIAEKVIKLATCPLLLLRAHGDTPASRIASVPN